MEEIFVKIWSAEKITAGSGTSNLVNRSSEESFRPGFNDEHENSGMVPARALCERCSFGLFWRILKGPSPMRLGINCLSAWERFGTFDEPPSVLRTIQVSIAFRLGNDSGPVYGL